jgi:uncharacterized membrane protein
MSEKAVDDLEEVTKQVHRSSPLCLASLLVALFSPSSACLLASPFAFLLDYLLASLPRGYPEYSWANCRPYRHQRRTKRKRKKRVVTKRTVRSSLAAPLSPSIRFGLSVGLPTVLSA